MKKEWNFSRVFLICIDWGNLLPKPLFCLEIYFSRLQQYWKFTSKTCVQDSFLIDRGILRTDIRKNGKYFSKIAATTPILELYVQKLWINTSRVFNPNLNQSWVSKRLCPYNFPPGPSKVRVNTAVLHTMRGYLIFTHCSHVKFVYALRLDCFLLKCDSCSF